MQDQTPLTRVQRENIIDYFHHANLTDDEQERVLRILTGENRIDTLTQAQASVVLAAMVAKGYDGLGEWARDLTKSRWIRA